MHIYLSSVTGIYDYCFSQMLGLLSRDFENKALLRGFDRDELWIRNAIIQMEIRCTDALQVNRYITVYFYKENYSSGLFLQMRKRKRKRWMLLIFIIITSIWKKKNGFVYSNERATLCSAAICSWGFTNVTNHYLECLFAFWGEFPRKINNPE